MIHAHFVSKLALLSSQMNCLDHIDMNIKEEFSSKKMHPYDKELSES